MRGKVRMGHGIGVVLICLWSVFPIYWALNTSLMSNARAQSTPAQYVPIPPDFANYALIFGVQSSSATAGSPGPDMIRALINTFIECAAATVVTVIVAILSAYAFARMEFRFKRIILYSVIATLALPVYATLIPLYRIMSNLGLVNTYIGIVLVYVSGFLPLAMWILYSYFSTLPKALEEAAFIDGASALSALLRIMIPLALPGITAAAIITFLTAWGQFIFPLVLSSDMSAEPLTVFMTALQGQHTVPYTLLNATGMVAIVVPGVIVMFLNRYIVSGILAGSVK